MAAEKLSEEDLVNFREAFRKFDPEETDVVSVENIGNVLRAAGQAPTVSDIEDYTKVRGEDYFLQVDYLGTWSSIFLLH